MTQRESTFDVAEEVDVAPMKNIAGSGHIDPHGRGPRRDDMIRSEWFHAQNLVIAKTAPNRPQRRFLLPTTHQMIVLHLRKLHQKLVLARTECVQINLVERRKQFIAPTGRDYLQRNYTGDDPDL